MMKKKSMAVAMAAVTVAMPASQVFAAVVDNTQTEEIKAMKAKALELMNKKFTTDGNLLKNNGLDGTESVADENVFKIELTTPGNANPDSCVSYAEFERKFDKAYAKLEDGQSLKIGYKYANEVGYSTLEDGQVVDFKLEKYTEKELEDLAVNVKNDGTIDEEFKFTNESFKIGQVKATELSEDGTKKFEVRLSDDKNGLARYKELKVGDVELSLKDRDAAKNEKQANRPVVRQENDYYVDINGNALAEVEDGDVATLDEDQTTVNITKKDGKEGPKLNKAQIDGFYADARTEAETPQIKMDVITKQGTEKVTLNSSDLYNTEEEKVTTEGNEILRKINFYNSLGDQKFYGATYSVEKTDISKDNEMTIKIFKTDKDSASEKTKIAEIKIVRDAKDTKADAYRAINDIIENEDDAYLGKTRVAAGADRYETAAEVSRMTFNDDNTDKRLTKFRDSEEKAVVLVTGAQDKLVDGLTATPLAASLNTTKGGSIDDAAGAPVLLTGNDTIAKPVLDEIERLGARKVYIVGGAISESVEKQLKDVHGLKVDRVDGDDRYETSMEVANKIADIRDTNKTDKVFIVGGKGEADALSAASIAAKEKAPILLTNKDKLSKDIKYFIDTDTTIKADGNDDTKAFVVGGTSSVSTGVYNEILDVVKTSNQIERLSGDNRQDTNADVVDRFFENAKKVVVAKSDNKGMVDALGAGLYAGLEEAPVILATNNLTKDQEDYLNKKTDIDVVDGKTAANSKVIVGNGISSTIAKFIKNLK